MAQSLSANGAPAGRRTRFYWLGRRHGGVLLFAAVFAVVSLLTRLILLARASGEVSWNPSLAAAFGWGLLFDLGAAAFCSLPLIALLTVLPENFLSRRWARAAAHLAGFALLYALLFGAVAELSFWEEFGVRLNFIAVDYLVYTTEVLGNIRESYNLTAIFGTVLVLTLLLGGMVIVTGAPAHWLRRAAEPARRRWRNGALWFAGALTLGAGLREGLLPAFGNNYNRELAKNGLWSLFAAFRNNVLDYQQFYRTLPVDSAFAALRTELQQDGSRLLAPEERDTLRYVDNPGPELRANVIQITVESLSADFLSTFNRASGLTPRLAEIAQKSLVFDNFYATGTRTDRGMEALTLSLPPTPGRSIVKRPNNEDMFTLGSVFRAKGYDTAFLYGGFGYFDNMNHFFGRNGYRVVDRNSASRDDITFANAWGACDEDLYRWTMREADAQHASGRPFHFFVMTTSNHRPYTFPDGRIDLPSKTSGRAGAVKYTDYAIGRFLDDAASKPWFKDTVFVIVADHCASSAGKTELPMQNYHIPLMVYAPGGQVEPGHVRALTSQMDYAPTLLGLLNWSYPSRFFGHDVRRTPAPAMHALIGNYQKLGHLEAETLVVLAPQQVERTYGVKLGSGDLRPAPHDEAAAREAIAYYQTASHLYQHGLYRALTPGEFRHYAGIGRRQEAPVSVALAANP